MNMKLVLASQSIRRAEILTQIGISFTVVPSGFDEESIHLDNPIEYVETLAFKKAESIPCSKEENIVVLGADTVVVIDEHVLEKPGCVAEAKKFLRLLSGREHQVYTGICLYRVQDQRTITTHQMTTVVFDTLTEEDIDFYTSTKEPFDKAGGYGIQGIGARFVKEIHGDYLNVVGLPVNLVLKLLKEMGEINESKYN